MNKANEQQTSSTNRIDHKKNAGCCGSNKANKEQTSSTKRIDQVVPVVHNRDFPEVPWEALNRKWVPEHFTYLRGREPIHIKELRSYVKTVHQIVEQGNWTDKHLVLNDNLSMCLAASKGRCADPKALMLLRRISAALLATGLQVYLRWIASELNAADKPSRRAEARQAAAAISDKFGHVSDDELCESQQAACHTVPAGSASAQWSGWGIESQTREHGEYPWGSFLFGTSARGTLVTTNP